MVRILTREDVRRLLTIDDCIAAVERAFRLHGEGKTIPPATLGVHVDGGGFHIKAAALDGRFVAKLNGNFPQNPAKHGLPTIQGVVILADAERGTPLAILDSIAITAMRTAAATAVAARYLARADARTVLVVGCGVQSAAQLAAVKRVRTIERVFALDLDRDKARAIGEPVDDFVPADIVITCTPSHRPFLGSRHVRPGTFIAAVGADHPEKSELEPGLLANSKVVADVIDQCAHMGDLHHALEAGAMRLEDVHADLGAVVSGRAAAREDDEEIIVFDSTGTALQDVAAASIVFDRAEEQEVGLRVDW